MIELDRPHVASASVVTDVCGVDVGFATRVDRPDQRLHFAEAELHGAHQAFMTAMETFYADGQPAGFFNIDTPERQQRNRLLDLGRTDLLLDLPASTYRRFGFTGARYHAWCNTVVRVMPAWQAADLYQHYQLRMLICEGTALVGMFNAMHHEPIRAWQRERVRMMIPEYAKRLRAERMLSGALRQAHRLAITMEGLGKPAFLLSHAGRLLTSNALGRALTNEPRVRDNLRATCRGERIAGHSRLELREPGNSSRVLVQVELAGTAAHTALAARTWRLSPREHQVFDFLASGASYRRISVALRISERTVEHHIASILEKSDTSSVAAAMLVAIKANR